MRKFNIVSRVKAALDNAATKYYVGTRAPSKAQYQWGLMALGLMLLAGGLALDSEAAYTPRSAYNDDRIAEAVDVVFLFINGTFGALIMVASGVAAILSSAFGQYRAALGLMVVAIGSFILRSLVKTWFNTQNLNDAIGDLQAGQTGN